MWHCDIRYAAAGNGKWIVHLDTQDAHGAKSERLALEWRIEHSKAYNFSIL